MIRNSNSLFIGNNHHDTNIFQDCSECQTILILFDVTQHDCTCLKLFQFYCTNLPINLIVVANNYQDHFFCFLFLFPIVFCNWFSYILLNRTICIESIFTISISLGHLLFLSLSRIIKYLFIIT